jgi:hypothetical protein
VTSNEVLKANWDEHTLSPCWQRIMRCWNTSCSKTGKVRQTIQPEPLKMTFNVLIFDVLGNIENKFW